MTFPDGYIIKDNIVRIGYTVVKIAAVNRIHHGDNCPYLMVKIGAHGVAWM